MANIYCGWASAVTVSIPCNGLHSDDAQLFEDNCSFSSFTYTFTPLEGDPNFTCDVKRTHTTLDWEPLGGIAWTILGNTTDSNRVGRLDVTFYDTDGNSYNQSVTITQTPCSTPTPADSYIRFVDSAVTANTFVECPLEVSGCSITGRTNCAFSATGDVNITEVFQALVSTSATCGIYLEENTGTTQLEGDVRVEFTDTSGNTYYDTIHVVQTNPAAPDRWIYTNPNSGYTSQNVQYHDVNVYHSGCNIDYDVDEQTYEYTYTDYTYTTSGDSIVTGVTPLRLETYDIDNNRARLRLKYNYATGTGRNDEYINFNFLDSDGNSYHDTYHLIQLGQRYGFVYLSPTERIHPAVADGSSTFYVRTSDITIDSSYTPTVTLSGEYDWITGTSINWNTSYGGSWRVRYYLEKNLSDHDKVAYITVDGVHDTDGYVYDGLVFTATKGWSAYTFLNYDSASASSAASVDTIEVVPVNTSVCSVSVTGSASSTPDLWTGVTQPTVTVLGNYITVDWPENPHTYERNLQLTVEAVWGEYCEKTTSETYRKNQEAAATPAQKDIEAEDTDYSVGSGSGNGSTTVQASGCTYDHFTYITGGSFSVTATSGPDNTIIFTYPENPTTSQRTGYVYVTFYDEDENPYGPQTITFTQQAGSSPGPGPSPEPETGYVLTTLTISDQEQHRYFVEARPGVVYSAAGQYYKTILACEARYSLYYVNSYGGVDVLPFKEKSWKKSDTVTRFNYSRSFRNNTLEFENVNYMNEIKASWELHTGWMSDESSQRMHELVESTIVYLYDAEEKTYTPVVMTDKKLEYKTYYNQGKKFYNYTVNVEESQSKERR